MKKKDKMTMKNAMDALRQEIREEVLSNEVMNGFECQWAFESQLLQNRGREVYPHISSYSLLFEPVHERYFHTRLRHTDNFVGQPH